MAITVTTLLDWFKLAVNATSTQEQHEREDLLFQYPEHQWADDVKKDRSAQIVRNVPIPARPMLSVATLDEPIQLVLNAEKRAHLGVQIHPLTEDASDDTAEVLQGLYRSIEVNSRANLARSWGYNRAVKAGRGCYRILTEYDRDTGVPGDQKIVIKRILYQGSVYFDPFAQEPDWSDAQWVIQVEDMPWTTYTRRFKKSSLKDADAGDLTSLGSEHPGWIGGDSEASRTVRVGEAYYLDHLDPIVHQVKNLKGEDVTIDEPRYQILYCKFNAKEFLEPPRLHNGLHLPYVPEIGRELQPVDGKRHWTGMIRPARDGVRLTNYAASGAVEMAALEPKAPWMMEEGQDEGHEEEFRQSNIRNIPVLHYRRMGLSGLPAEAPQRVRVDLSRLGPNMELLRMGKDFVQSATSTYDPALGKQPTAHRSGRAIVALQDQTLEGTGDFLDNLAQISITREAIIVLDLIPHVYDRPGRIARILDAEGKAQYVMLNQPYVVDPRTKRPQAANVPNPMQAAADQTNPVKFYNLNKGRYGVTVSIGKSYKSRLEAGSDAIGQILQADPQLMPLIGPEWLQFQDFPAHDKLATILQKVRAQQFPFLSEEGQQDATAKLAQAQQQLQGMSQQLQQAAEIIKTEQVKEAAKVEIEKTKAQVELEIQRMKNATAIRVAEIQASVKGYTTEATHEHETLALGLEQQHESEQAERDRQHETELAALAHAQALSEATHDAALQPAPELPA